MENDQLKEQVLSYIVDYNNYYNFINQCLLERVITNAYHIYLMNHDDRRTRNISQLFDEIEGNPSDIQDIRFIMATIKN